MNSLEEARGCVAGKIEPLEGARVGLGEALGCVLREDARAKEDMPGFDRSAMDGYAIGREDRADKFRIVGEARPGVRAEFVVRSGECARIFTGAEIPEGASQVLKQEDVRAEDGWMKPERRTKASFIRRRGEDAKAGDRLLEAGLRLGAAEIGLLANLGIVEPLVSRRCRVAHFATGDELVDPAEEPGPSRIRDSNTALVRAFAQEHGGVMMQQVRVADDIELLTERVRGAIEAGCDLVLISGGASVGAYDFGRTALERAGFEMHFEKVNLRPGKPLAFATREGATRAGAPRAGATRGRQAAFVLPGNPLSHLAVLHCIVRVAFERMAGTEPEWRVLNARLKEGIELGGDGRDTLWPGRIDVENGEAVVRALRWQSSGDITGLAGLNAFIRCAVPVLDTGARVPCILVHG
jgi:molybdopterin molybdotransferase